MDEVHHDLTAHERREARLRNLLHIMTIESNNLEMHLHADTAPQACCDSSPDHRALHTPSTFTGSSWRLRWCRTFRDDDISRWHSAILPTGAASRTWGYGIDILESVQKQAPDLQSRLENVYSRPSVPLVHHL